MTLEDALFSYLSGFAGLNALTGTRIYLGKAPEAAEKPYIVYQKISGPRIHSMGRDPSLRRPRYQFTAWDKTLVGAKKVSAQVLEAFKDYKNQLMGGVNGVYVQAVLCENDGIDHYDPESKLSGNITDFIIWYEE